MRKCLGKGGVRIGSSVERCRPSQGNGRCYGNAADKAVEV